MPSSRTQYFLSHGRSLFFFFVKIFLQELVVDLETINFIKSSFIVVCFPWPHRSSPVQITTIIIKFTDGGVYNCLATTNLYSNLSIGFNDLLRVKKRFERFERQKEKLFCPILNSGFETYAQAHLTVQVRGQLVVERGSQNLFITNCTKRVHITSGK
jgi:hypothetical protein